MNDLKKMAELIGGGSFDERFLRLYENAETARKRYLHLIDLFKEQFENGEDIRFFSAPGRTEVCGNHTDHNKGKVIAAAINLDAAACASKTDNNIIFIKSENYPGDRIDLSVLTPQKNEREKSASLVRGVASRFKQLGYNIGGFNAVTVNNVLKGSGMSSSASYEVLVGTMLNYLYNDGKISPVTIAEIAQYAENEFFGKPCGLMDQMACSVGGFVKIDFGNGDAPVIEPVSFDFASCGHSLCIVDTRADHADLTDEYASIRSEMEAVAGIFGKKCLRETSEDDVLNNIALIRDKLGERPVLRALHFYAENKRVDCEAEALAKGDFEKFKEITISSGLSSYTYNQNVFAASAPQSQPVALALALSEKVLSGKGAWRVHGGGFAGTIQAFVPNELLSKYKSTLESVFGEGACYVLKIRPVGGTEV
ncbi:MAG: galactokinase [Oscillospiraceae bacterium]|nr:galactokinase [Oscillospiraceae bacterium]